MDKNYNVDDILSEIKSRKAREKERAGQTAKAAGQPAASDFSRLTPKPVTPEPVYKPPVVHRESEQPPAAKREPEQPSRKAIRFDSRLEDDIPPMPPHAVPRKPAYGDDAPPAAGREPEQPSRKAIRFDSRLEDDIPPMPPYAVPRKPVYGDDAPAATGREPEQPSRKAIRFDSRLEDDIPPMPPYAVPRKPAYGDDAPPATGREPEQPSRKAIRFDSGFDDDIPPMPKPAQQAIPRDFIPRGFDGAREVPSRAPGSEGPATGAIAESDTGTFRFLMPEPPEEKKNPLDFESHVRPITEKAKIRGGAKRELHQLSLDAEEPPEPETPPAVNFTRFRGRREPEISTEAEQERTRVLPSMAEMNGGAAYDEVDSDYYDDLDYVPEEPVGAVMDYSEYNSTSDRRDVQFDIAKVKLWLFIRSAATLILTLILFYFALAGKFEAIPMFEAVWPEGDTMRMYLLVCTILTIAVALVGSSAVGGGLIGLFKMHANSDTLAACAILAAVGQGVAAVANYTLVDAAEMNLYFCVASLAMLFNCFGKMTMINRILANFRIISSDVPKKALIVADSDEFCREFVRDRSHRRPTVGYSVKAGFFTDFLGLSYSDKYDVGVNRAVAPVCLVGAIVVGAATYLLTSSMQSAISALTAILCVCATLSSTFIENVPLARLTKKLAPQGGMVSGNKAVEDFCDTKALVVTERDLFPDGHVRLQGIKAFSQGRIDEAILDAASVLCALDGALGPVFLEMIGGNKKLLKNVDNIVFENAMGVSAWVDSRRVLIGNRKLMQNHGVALPPEALRQRQSMSNDIEPLYLSNSGEVSAQFTVGYHIDESLALELDRLAAHEIQLIVKTTDANITTEKIWELYGYPQELVTVLPAEWHERFAEMSKPRDKAIAEIVYTGRAIALVKAVLACIMARSSILSATVIQLIQIVLGYGLVAFMAFMGQIGSLSITEICVYQAFWFLAIFIVQQVRQS